MANAAVENFDSHVLRAWGAARKSERRQRRRCTLRRVPFRSEGLWLWRIFILFWHLSSCFAHVCIPPDLQYAFNTSSGRVLLSLASHANVLANRASKRRIQGWGHGLKIFSNEFVSRGTEEK